MNDQERTDQRAPTGFEAPLKNLIESGSPVFYRPVMEKMIQRKKELAQELRSSFVSSNDLQIKITNKISNLR